MEQTEEQETSKYKSGDVVIDINTKMTVREHKDGKVVCNWFDKDKLLHQESFDEKELELVLASV